MKIVDTNLKFKGALSKRQKTDLILVHHIGTMPRSAVNATIIHGWHQNKGWSGIGYHLVILKDGTIESGRPLDTVGAHCQGSNATSVGINVVGDFEVEEPTAAQKQALIEVLKYLKAKYPNTQIKGHRECQANTCPGKNLYKQLGEIKCNVNQK